MSMRLGVVCSFVCTVVVAAPPSGVAPLPFGNWYAGGIVDDSGRVELVASTAVDDGHAGNSPLASAERSLVLVRSRRGRVQTIPLGGMYSGTNRATFLDGGGLLLWGLRGPVVGGYTARTLDLVEVRGGEVRRLWGWDSREDAPECRHCPPPIVSRDGRMWGHASRTGETSTRVTFTFGRTGKWEAPTRVELVDFPNPDKGKLPMWGHFWFLDTSGPVVLVPWSGGGFIVRFTDGASPHVVPVLQGSTQWGFTWQNEERVLWAADQSRLRAYNLWDLGSSGFPVAPFWDLATKDGWEPHAERGAVRVVNENDAHRIEHLWREPWTLFEERHVSAWTPGSSPGGGIGIGVLVSPNGRHAAVLEQGLSDDDEEVTYLSRFGLDRVPVRPPVEAALAGEKEEPAATGSNRHAHSDLLLSPEPQE